VREKSLLRVGMGGEVGANGWHALCVAYMLAAGTAAGFWRCSLTASPGAVHALLYMDR